MSEFNALIDDLEDVLWSEEQTLAKAQQQDADDAQDDEDIKDMADGDADDDGEPDAEDALDDRDDDEKEEQGDEAPMAKAYPVTLADGSQAEAFDGTALLKSLEGQIASIRSETVDALTQVTQALTRSTLLIKALRQQHADLSDQVASLAQAGRGRKSQVHVHERRMTGEDLVKANGIKPADLMSKALSAQRDGRVTGAEVAEIDAYLAHGIAIPDPLIAKLGG